MSKTTTGQLAPTTGPRSLYEGRKDLNCWTCNSRNGAGQFACSSLDGAVDGWIDDQEFTDGMPPRETDPCPDHMRKTDA